MIFGKDSRKFLDPGDRVGPAGGISSATYTVVSVTPDRGHDASDMDHRGLAGHLVIIFVCSTSCGGSTLVAKRSWSFFTPSKAL